MTLCGSFIVIPHAYWKITKGMSANQSHTGKIMYYYVYCRRILENTTKDLKAIKISFFLILRETISTVEPSSNILETK